MVALRKESVDRNRLMLSVRLLMCLSLSARRAWIEIMLCLLFRPVVGVALRKESVDRNTNFNPASLFDLPSLSARRAWIEIYNLSDIEDKFGGRSPQGERG